MSRGAIALIAVLFALAGWQVTRSQPEDPLPPPLVATTAPAAPPGPSPASGLAPLPQVEGPAPRAKSYATAQALAEDLAQKGLVCTSLNPLDQPDRTLQEFALCDMGDPSRRLDIYLFPGRPNRDLWLPGMKDLNLVFGPNWIVVGAGDVEGMPKRLLSVRNAIGGKLRIR